MKSNTTTKSNKNVWCHIFKFTLLAKQAVEKKFKTFILSQRITEYFNPPFLGDLA